MLLGRLLWISADCSFSCLSAHFGMFNTLETSGFIWLIAVFVLESRHKMNFDCLEQWCSEILLELQDQIFALAWNARHHPSEIGNDQASIVPVENLGGNRNEVHEERLRMLEYRWVMKTKQRKLRTRPNRSAWKDGFGSWEERGSFCCCC